VLTKGKPCVFDRRIEISERHCCQVIVFRLELDPRNSTDELKVYDVVERLVR